MHFTVVKPGFFTFSAVPKSGLMCIKRNEAISSTSAFINVSSVEVRVRVQLELGIGSDLGLHFELETEIELERGSECESESEIVSESDNKSLIEGQIIQLNIE